MHADEEFELITRAAFAKGQIAEAIGELDVAIEKLDSLGLDRALLPEVRRAERALRYAIAELNGTARATDCDE